MTTGLNVDKTALNSFYINYLLWMCKIYLW